MNKPQVVKWIKRFSHLAALMPLVVLIFDYFTQQLTFNPIQAATQRTGRIAVTLLTIMLACTPLFWVTRIRVFSALRKPIGLYSFMYASIHLLIFLVLDYTLMWEMIYREIVQKPFILLGLSAFLILLAMAGTSFQWTIAFLGRYWKPLHRLVYLVSVGVVIHYFLALKGNILTVSGNIVQPIIYSLIITILLIVRLPAIRDLIQVHRSPVKRKKTEGRVMDPKTPKNQITQH